MKKYFKPIAKTIAAITLAAGIGCIDPTSEDVNPEAPASLVEAVEKNCSNIERRSKEGEIEFAHVTLLANLVDNTNLKCRRDHLAFMDREGVIGFMNYKEIDFKNRQYSEHVYANGDLAYAGTRLNLEDPIGNAVMDLYEYRVEKYMRLAEGGWKRAGRVYTYTTIGRRPYSREDSNVLDLMMGKPHSSTITDWFRSVFNSGNDSGN
jgi:hypothetical protein